MPEAYRNLGHTGVFCDSCNRDHIEGDFYRCGTCGGYDLCVPCGLLYSSGYSESKRENRAGPGNRREPRVRDVLAGAPLRGEPGQGGTEGITLTRSTMPRPASESHNSVDQPVSTTQGSAAEFPIPNTTFISEDNESVSIQRTT